MYKVVERCGSHRSCQCKPRLETRDIPQPREGFLRAAVKVRGHRDLVTVRRAWHSRPVTLVEAARIARFRRCGRREPSGQVRVADTSFQVDPGLPRRHKMIRLL
jgi:hypothetical protein